MSLTWAHPSFLIGIAVLAVVGMVLLHRRRRHSRRWRMVCIVLPGAAASCLIATLAGPAVETSPPARELVVLLDLSGSTRSSPWRNPAWLRTFVQERTPPGTRVTVVGFARATKTLLENISPADPGRWPGAWPMMDEDGTDLVAAMRWQTSPDDRRPRWLLTDGLLNFTPLETATTPVAVTVTSPTKVDVGIIDFQLRDAPTPKPTVGPELQLTLRSTGKARSTAEVRRAGTLIASRVVTFASATTQVVTVSDPTPLPEPSLQYEAILAAQADPWPENDRASLLTPPRGPPATLLVSSADTPPPAASAQITRVDPKSFPARLSDLLPYQIIVLDDVPATALRPDAIDSLDKFVRDTGGGLLLLGRSRAFGPGRYLATPLESLSPLSSTPPERPPLHVVFLLDASGSMKESVGGTMKFSYVASGVAEATRVLRPTDRLTAVIYGDRRQKIADGTKTDTAAPLADTLRHIVPSGPTDPDKTVDLFESTLDENTMVVLLTDGEIPRMDISRWKALLAATKAKLTLVAPRDPSTRTLAELAKATAATWLATDDATAWPRLLRQAVEDPHLGKARQTPAQWRLPAGPPSSTTQWIETWLAPDARPLAQAPAIPDPAGKPLAAIARRGLGQVAAVSFADASAPYTTLVDSLFRDITPPPGDRRFVAEISRLSGRCTVTLRGHETARFLNGAVLQARIIAHDGRDFPPLPIPQIGPGEYAADLPQPPEVFSLVISRQDKDHPGLVARLSPAALAASEWPASTFEGEVPTLPNITRLDATSTGVWRPREIGVRKDPRALLLVIAAGALIVALYWRRGGR